MACGLHVKRNNSPNGKTVSYKNELVLYQLIFLYDIIDSDGGSTLKRSDFFGRYI